MGSCLAAVWGQCSDWEGSVYPCSLPPGVSQVCAGGDMVALAAAVAVPHVFGREEQPKQQKMFSLMF